MVGAKARGSPGIGIAEPALPALHPGSRPVQGAAVADPLPGQQVRVDLGVRRPAVERITTALVAIPVEHERSASDGLG
jgi:hypothetical protein